MRLVYVADMYSDKSDEEIDVNVERAVNTGRTVLDLGGVPVVPHVAFDRYRHDRSYEFFIGATKELMRRCDAVYLGMLWYLSRGARGEARAAMEWGIPVFIDASALEHWLTASAADPAVQKTLETQRALVLHKLGSAA